MNWEKAKEKMRKEGCRVEDATGGIQTKFLDFEPKTSKSNSNSNVCSLLHFPLKEKAFYPLILPFFGSKHQFNIS